jgi:hypothetical protein
MQYQKEYFLLKVMKPQKIINLVLFDILQKRYENMLNYIYNTPKV